MIIEPATAADLDAIHDIERHSFKQVWAREAYEASKAAQSTPGAAERPPPAPLDPASPKAR